MTTRFSSKFFAGFLASAALAFSVNGCFVSKLKQCNDAIEIINAHATKFQQLGTKLGTIDANAENATQELEKVITEIDQQIDDLDAKLVKLDPSDEKLKSLLANYIAFTKEAETNLNNLSAALKAKDNGKLISANAALQTSAASESIHVNALNAYCQTL